MKRLKGGIAAHAIPKVLHGISTLAYPCDYETNYHSLQIKINKIDLLNPLVIVMYVHAFSRSLAFVSFLKIKITALCINSYMGCTNATWEVVFSLTLLICDNYMHSHCVVYRD